MKKEIAFSLTIIGAVLVAASLWFLKSSTAVEGTMAVLPYIAIGIGCGAFGHGMGELISKRALKNSPEISRQITIEQKDERNIAIANHAKAKAYDAMIYIYAALNISFALMDIPIYVVILLVFTYLIVVSISVYYRCKYDREM